MRSLLRNLARLALALPLAACVDPETPDGDAAFPGVIAQVESMPRVTIDDELGTEVRLFVDLEHFGGPAAQTLEIVSASLMLDNQHYAAINLKIPADAVAFEGLAEDDQLRITLHGYTGHDADDWGLCQDPQDSTGDENRVGVGFELRVTPGANSEADVFVFENLAVELTCSITG